MRLQLVHGRLHLVVQKQVLQPLIRETRYADGADTSLLVKPLHSPPCGVVISVGLVHQVEVEIVQSEFLHREVERTQRIVVLIVLYPQFGGYKKLFAFDTALPDGIA